MGYVFHYKSDTIYKKIKQYLVHGFGMCKDLEISAQP